MTDTMPSRGPDYRGHIDVFGFHDGAGGLFFIGWVSDDIAAALPDADLVLGFEKQDLDGRGVAVFYPRSDLPPHSTGMVLFVAAGKRPAGEFFSIATRAHRGKLAVTPTQQVAECGAAALAEALAPVLAQASAALPAAVHAALFPPPPIEPYDGANTMAALAGRVMLEIDHAVLCPPDGVAIIGWLLAAPGALTGVALRSGRRALPLDPARFVRLPRPGVIEAIGGAHGFGPDEARCGFIAFAAEGYDPALPAALEVTTETGQTGLRPLPPPLLRGLPAIRLLLTECDMQFADVAPAFDDVLGPAIARLAAARLRAPGAAARADFGPPPAAPSASIVVPLYGGLDHLELQLALLADDPAMHGVELLLVLDDPPRRRDLENLADSLWARFRLPFSLLFNARNLGFAPACGVGLAAARGPHVCFLNSDVFPLAPGWLPALAARLDADPTLGIVAPLLLHDDGTVQHQGMRFRRQPRHGNWHFSEHVGHGLYPAEGGGLAPAIAVTGACIVMPTDLARRLGGFDPAYVIGDFEDSDLCLRAAAAGFASAVDGDVRLCHLGRQSQAAAAERWRMNLTLYNAWVHQQRWAATLDEGDPA